MDSTRYEASMRAYYGERAPLMRYENLKADDVQRLDTYMTYIIEKLRGRKVLEIACGTGFWTRKLAEHAEQVFGTDAASEMLEQAHRRSYQRNNVQFAHADAFALDGVPGGWDGGFHMQWFSHVPRSRIADFLSVFHSKLLPGAHVVFGDNKDRGTDPDDEGNLYQDRVLPSGSRYRIIKNWPDEHELREILRPYARSIEFREFERDWFMSYVLDSRMSSESQRD